MDRRYGSLTVVALIVLSVAGLSLPTATAGGGGGGFCAEGTFSDQASTSVAMMDMCFTPTVARIEPGDTVIFHNKDATPHMVSGVSNVFGNSRKDIPNGEAVSYRFDDEGVFPYMCVLHPGMVGAIVVGDGEGKTDAAGAVTVEPPAPQAEAAPASDRAETEDKSKGASWVVPVAVALGLGVLALAAIPMKRRRGSGVIATKL